MSDVEQVNSGWV